MANFDKMPAELRNLVYEELFQNSKRHDSHQQSNDARALFTVSRQLHDETTSYFYQHNVMTVDATAKTSDAATLLPPLADKYLRYLRRLRMYATTGQAKMPSVQSSASMIASLTTIGAHLDELHIVICSHLSNLLNSRVDDSTLDAEHPITVAIYQLLTSNVAKHVYVELKNVSFATGVAHALHSQFGSKLSFVNSKGRTVDWRPLEQPLTGRYSSMHLTALGLEEEHISSSVSDASSTTSSTPSSLPSSLCSAFTELDAFSVTTFELGHDSETNKTILDDYFEESSAGEQPFFTEDDIEEWQASTQEHDYSNTQEETHPEDIDDIEMEDVPQVDVEAIMDNLERTAQHIANEQDITYMTNYAPDLLLSRHQLGHLI